MNFSYSQDVNTDALPRQDAHLKDLPQTERVVQIATKFIKRGALHPYTESFADALGVVEAVWSENEDVMAAVIGTHGTGFKVYFRKTPSDTTNEEYLVQIGDNKKKNKNAWLLIRKI